MRGSSFGVGLDNPKNQINVGHALRACGCFGASFLIVGDRRIKCRAVTDTARILYQIPVFRSDDILTQIPFNHVPVAVELTDGATNIVDYQHPENAFYIFGAEDATLGDRILSRCRDMIKIPSYYCLNLAACVNVVLYDRIAKQQRKTRGEFIETCESIKLEFIDPASQLRDRNVVLSYAELLEKVPGGADILWEENSVVSRAFEVSGEAMHEEWGEHECPLDALFRLYERAKKAHDNV